MPLLSARSAPLPRADLGVPAAFVAATIAAVALGGAATGSSTQSAWFADLEKPSWYPPPATFGIVWTPLYVAIAASAVLAWRAGAPKRVLVRWWVQLVLNVAWSVLFFGLRRPGWALAEIVVLFASILATIEGFRRYDRRAALLLVPYAAWVAFAALLNGSIVTRN